MGAQGIAVLDFGASPEIDTDIDVIDQATIAADSHVEAFFMRDTTGDNSEEEHGGMALFCSLSAGGVVPGTGFTIFANMLAGYATGTFNVRWVWN